MQSWAQSASDFGALLYLSLQKNVELYPALTNELSKRVPLATQVSSDSVFLEWTLRTTAECSLQKHIVNSLSAARSTRNARARHMTRLWCWWSRTMAEMQGIPVVPFADYLPTRWQCWRGAVAHITYNTSHTHKRHAQEKVLSSLTVLVWVVSNRKLYTLSYISSLRIKLHYLTALADCKLLQCISNCCRSI